MIFTSCTECDTPIVVNYEAGDKGAGGARRIECEMCKTVNFVELVSINGETLSEEAFFEKHPDAKVKI